MFAATTMYYEKSAFCFIYLYSEPNYIVCNYMHIYMYIKYIYTPKLFTKIKNQYN